MDRLACLNAFVETARRGGMSAAARELGVPRARISRQIQTLEQELGVRLLSRTTRALALTDAGAQLLESASDALQRLEEATCQVREAQGIVQGKLRVNAPMSFGIRVLAPLLSAFQRANPGLELHVDLSDEFVDPVRGGYDVTLRVAQLEDSSLVARRLCDAPRVLVAAPSYLAARGTPKSPEELERHQCLSYRYLSGGSHWLLARGGKAVRIETRGPVCANNGDLLMHAAIGGSGIALLPRFIVDDAIERRALKIVMPEWQAPPIAVHAVYPSSRNMPLRTRRFIDYLIESLRTQKR
jgi:DNA-binding transcriptional LysR family regulator